LLKKDKLLELNFIMKKNQGFTLIELLVVVAIIGILSSVILASLNSARDKGKDAAVKSQLASMKAQAELYYSTNNESYLGLCSAAADVKNGFGGGTNPGLLKAAGDSDALSITYNLASGTAGTYNQVTCHEAAESWAVEAPMNDSATGATKASMYCVDSSGVSKVTNVNLGIGISACS